MLKSIRAKILLAILAVTMFTAGSLTVVFYLRAAGMIEKTIPGSCTDGCSEPSRSGRNPRDLLCEYETAWDEEIRNNAADYLRTGNENSLENMAGLFGNTAGNIKISTRFILFFG